MKFRFKQQPNGNIYAFNERSTQRLATYAQTENGWECTPNPKVELASADVATAMDEQFADWITARDAAPKAEDVEEEEVAETPEEKTFPEPPVEPLPTDSTARPPKPSLDPISGTAGIAYMQWHGQYGTDEEIKEIYGDRIKNKPSFLAWINRTPELETFAKRIAKL